MSIGFKEWTLICDALGSGAQSIILRKGGIAEGRAGFRFQHDDFLLFPTLFHEQVAEIEAAPGDALARLVFRKEQIAIHYRVHVEWTQDLDDLSKSCGGSAPFHLWRDEVIEERFRYDEKQGVSLAFVRVKKLSAPFVFPSSPRFGGCRSWGDASRPAARSRCGTAALTDAAHRERESQIRALSFKDVRRRMRKTTAQSSMPAHWNESGRAQ